MSVRILEADPCHRPVQVYTTSARSIFFFVINLPFYVQPTYNSCSVISRLVHAQSKERKFILVNSIPEVGLLIMIHVLFQ